MTLHVIDGEHITTTFEVHADLIQQIITAGPHVLHRRTAKTEQHRASLDTPNPT